MIAELLLASAIAAQPLPDFQTVQVVVVRADRLPQRGGSDGAALVVGSDAMIARVPGRLDAILVIEAPGAGLFRRNDSATANATIQGISLRPIAPNGASRAAVRIDGLPQNDPFGGWVYWGRHDPLFLETVTVAASGAGATGGPQGLTGLIDMSEQRGSFTRARVSLGGAGTQNLAVALGRSLGNGQIGLALGHDESAGRIGVPAPQRGPVDTPVSHRFSSLTLSADIAPDGSAERAVSGRISLFAEEKASGLAGGQSASEGGDASLAFRFSTPMFETRLLAWGQVRDFSNLVTSANATRTATTPTLDQYATPASQFGGSILIAQADGPLSAMLELTSSEGQTRELFRNQGAGFTRDRIAGGHQDVASLVLEQAPVRAGGVSLSWALRADRWSNHDAIRLELDRASGAPVLDSPPAGKEGIAWQGRLNAAHAASGLSAEVYRTSRLPTLNELHRPFRVGNDATDANGGLEPETLTGIDLGWRGEGMLAGLAWSARTTLWWNRFDDPIINVTRGAGPGTFGRIGFLPAGGAYRVRENAGRIEAQGLELAASLEVAGAGEQPGLRLAVGLSDARIAASGAVSQLNGLRPAQTPQHSGSLTLGLPFGGSGAEAGLDRFRLDLTARHEGDRFEDDLNTRSLDKFFALDARAAWRLGPGVEIFASGENLADATIQARLDGDGLITLSSQRLIRFGVLVRR